MEASSSPEASLDSVDSTPATNTRPQLQPLAEPQSPAEVQREAQLNQHFPPLPTLSVPAPAHSSLQTSPPPPPPLLPLPQPRASSAPTSPTAAPPAVPPTLPPPALLPRFPLATSTPTVTATPPPPPAAVPGALSSFFGPLDALQRTALRQTKWPLVLILPPAQTFSAAPAAPLVAPTPVGDSVMLWRRLATSPDAQRYTNFFPVDGLPHLALLDPRSGERLAVWGNGGTDDDTDGNGGGGSLGMVGGALDEELWETVMRDVAEFLPLHSLEDDKLGPVHRAEKPWAVRTRRTSSAPSASAQQSTTILDDEEAALAAAIAASLADMDSSEPSQGATEMDDDDLDHEVEEDDEDDDDEDEGDNDDDTSNDMNSATDIESIAPSTSSPMFTSAAPSSPVPTRRLQPTSQPMTPIPMATPSSIESLSSSYLDRMASCMRSQADPELIERRRLREQQDAELKEAMQLDRAKAEASTQAKEIVDNAMARLPAEPPASDKTALSIAVKLPDGKRLARRFSPFAKVSTLADLVIADGGHVPDIKFTTVDKVLSSPGLNLAGVMWETPLSDLRLPRRSMFLLQARKA